MDFIVEPREECDIMLENAKKNGLIVLFKRLRDIMYGDKIPKEKKYAGADVMFVPGFKNIKIAKNIGGYTEIANNQLDLLGIIYFDEQEEQYKFNQCGSFNHPYEFEEYKRYLDFLNGKDLQLK